MTTIKVSIDGAYPYTYVGVITKGFDFGIGRVKHNTLRVVGKCLNTGGQVDFTFHEPVCNWSIGS